MSIARKVYGAAKVGSVVSISATRVGSLGAGVDANGYERFKEEVWALEALERSGKVRIDERHHESATGQRYVDHVRFTRLA